MFRYIRIAGIVIFALAALYVACETSPAVREGSALKVEYIYPPEEAVDIGKKPYFVWKEFTEVAVSYYELKVRDAEESGTEHIYQVTDTFFHFPETLEDVTRYKWRVDVTTTLDETFPGDYWYYTTASDFNNPPLVPFDPDPESPSSDIHLYKSLAWDCYDPDGDDLTYDVWLDTFLGDSILIADNVPVKSADPGGLDPDTRYLWKVVAHDDQGDSMIGPWWEFKTITASNKPPVAPWGPSPANNATDQLLDVTLSWSCEDPEDDPITYDVAIGPAGGTLLVVGDDITETSFEVTGLDQYTEYDWFVTACDDHDNVKSGPVWSFTTGDGVPVEEIFAVLKLNRNVSYSEGSGITRVDQITARFDGEYAWSVPIDPRQPAAVSCGSFDLVWLAGSGYYSYSDYIAGYFLTPGSNYTFTITEGDGVPSLTSDLINFSGCTQYITSPEAFSFVSIEDGFDLEWHTFCGGRIDITIMDLNSADSTGVYIRTDNDGSYTFTPGDLETIDPMAYQFMIVLIDENMKTITAQGYDQRSVIWTRTLSTQMVMRQM